MDFTLPEDLVGLLAKIDEFIEREIRPLERENDNIRFFDHRREDARTDWDRGGLPNQEWEALLAEARRRADAAGFYRYPFPKQYGGMDGTNLGMAVIREHLASKGLGLHCDLQNEHAIVGNNMLRALIHKTAWTMDTYGTFSASREVSMCNYWANRLCCEAADRAMQVHGGLGYSRHKPFEHIYRHHRRYRITEGSEEIQMRRVAGYMFGYMKQKAPMGVSGTSPVPAGQE
jgi:alkylation response protein AidB-like acyl-CoA dehydrogenase